MRGQFKRARSWHIHTVLEPTKARVEIIDHSGERLAVFADLENGTLGGSAKLDAAELASLRAEFQRRMNNVSQ